MSNEESISLQLQICSTEPRDPERIDDDAVALRDEFRELGIQVVDPTSSGPSPRGAKSPEMLTVGGIAVAVVPEMLKELIKLVFDWIQRDPCRTIKIRQKVGGPEYELTGSWKADQLATLMKALARQDAKAEPL
jgi:hypothetical protein